MALKLPTSAGPQFHIAKQTYVYVHASINIYDLNSAQRREAPGNPSQLVTCIALLTPFYQSFSFPLRNKETGVIDTVSRVSRSVPNRDIVLFYHSVISFRRFVISFRRFVIPWFTDCPYFADSTYNFTSQIHKFDTFSISNTIKTSMQACLAKSQGGGGGLGSSM